MSMENWMLACLFGILVTNVMIFQHLEKLRKMIGKEIYRQHKERFGLEDDDE